jgi:hypothetical protein
MINEFRRNKTIINILTSYINNQIALKYLNHLILYIKAGFIKA